MDHPVTSAEDDESIPHRGRRSSFQPISDAVKLKLDRFKFKSKYKLKFKFRYKCTRHPME